MPWPDHPRCHDCRSAALGLHRFAGRGAASYNHLLLTNYYLTDERIYCRVCPQTRFIAKQK